MEASATRPAAIPLPTGTVTFLFSDIEGSTERWDRYRAAMQDALRRHDALVRAAIEAHNGYVFKTVGDEFCTVFHTVADAAAAALAIQRSIAGQDWTAVDGLRVREAVHTGVTDERNGDYYGPTVNRVARLLAVAHGEQVVFSGVAADLAQGMMPPQSSLRDLGLHRLKDLANPEQVYQLVAPDLRAEFPPLRSLDALPNNLPLQLTTFVGRDDTIAEIKGLLERSRIVTLVGTGGVGKTRTALQLAADLLDGSGDGVWLIELAPLADPSLVTTAISAALGVSPSSDQSALDALLGYLKNKLLLIVLDNCEHVVTEAARIADAIIRSAPHVRLIATSREGLNVTGEYVYRMPSLSVPPPGARLTGSEAMAYGAVALFSERAYAADGRFSVTDENATAVGDICRRLDGIALAIELAAPRVKVLAVQQLAQRLDERFRILTGGSRSALPRQQTMRALIDWSYDLLSEDERAFSGAHRSSRAGGRSTRRARFAPTNGSNHGTSSTCSRRSSISRSSRPSCKARHSAIACSNRCANMRANGLPQATTETPCCGGTRSTFAMSRCRPNTSGTHRPNARGWSGCCRRSTTFERPSSGRSSTRTT